MKNFQKILERIGLSERESRVYLDLLDHPFSSMIEVSRRTGIHRPVLYVLLPLLKERGIVFAKEKGKRTLYHASSPVVLQDLAREMESKLQSIIPDLQFIYDSKGDHISIIHHDGIIGIQKIYQEMVDTLPPDGEYYAYTGKNNLADQRFFTPRYWETRDRKRLKRYVIAPMDRVPFFNTDPHRNVVHFQKKTDTIFEKNIVKIIYANRVAVIDFSQITGIVIESPLLAVLEKQQFQLLFGFLKERE